MYYVLLKVLTSDSKNRVLKSKYIPNFSRYISQTCSACSLASVLDLYISRLHLLWARGYV